MNGKRAKKLRRWATLIHKVDPTKSARAHYQMLKRKYRKTPKAATN